MKHDEVAEVLVKPISQELLGSSIPARLAYVGVDSEPRVIPIAFLWTGGHVVAYTAPRSAKVRALGYEFGRRGTDVQETQTVFGHGGAGGGYAYADTATGVAFALMKNRLAPDFGAAEQVSGIVANIVADG